MSFRMPRAAVPALGLAVFAALTFGGCAAGGGSAGGGSAADGSDASASTNPDTDATPTTLTVFAAASLTEAFDALAADFEAQHPDLDVALSYGGSAALAQQIVEGAPVDVFASASRASDAAPHGTVGSQSAMRRSGSARSASSVTAAGLPAGTTSSSVFVANTTGSSASPASTTTRICGSAAEAKTSTGAPSTICCASAALPP